LANAPMPRFFQSEPRHAYFQRTAFSIEQWQRLRAHCTERGIEFLSSPFSVEAVELLERVGVARYKVPSGEVTNLPLLEAIAQTRKPVLISSGMSSWAELDEAVATIVRHHRQVTVLQCTSAYPCPYEDVGLNAMREMGERYGLPVGLSDHTLTPYASLAAVAWGASVIEKHLTFSRRMYGSDAAHSMEPGEFADLVRGVRAVATMCATRVDKTAMAERLRDMKAVFEKSVVSRTAIPAGTPITAAMVGLKKPGTGIPARRLREFIGRRVIRDVARDTLLREDDFGA
jgi:N-acetylneuraminate synthase